FAGAGAAAGGTMDVPMGVPMGELQERRPSGLTSQLFGRVASSLVLLAWVSLTVALALRWINIGHPPYVTLYEINTMLVYGMTTIYLILFEGVLKTRAAGVFVTLLIF